MSLHVKLQIALLILLVVAGALFLLVRNGPKSSVETIQGRLGAMEKMMDEAER